MIEKNCIKHQVDWLDTRRSSCRHHEKPTPI